MSFSAFYRKGFLKMFSKVAIAIKKKDYDELISEIQKLDYLSAREKHYLLETVWKSASPLYPRKSKFYNEYTLLHFKKIKWDFEEKIKGFEFVKNYIFNLDNFQFIRIGENYNDIEEKTKGDDSNLQMLRLEKEIIFYC